MGIIHHAEIFAMAAHGAIGQKRKYTGEDYIEHPRRVVGILQSIDCNWRDVTPEMIAAAWLHDVVEDTRITNAVIARIFGADVAKLVEELTDITNLLEGNRAHRNAINRKRLSLVSPKAQTIKYADLIDNTHDILKHDPKFGAVYLEEKRELLAVMDKGDTRLYELACNMASVAV